MRSLPLPRFSFVLLLLALATTPPLRAAEPRKPNILFILTDDLGYGDVGVFFQNQRREKASRAEPWHLTPQLDAMAAQGVQLRHHYCPSPVCAPSRASLLTGVHQGQAHIRDNQFDKALENNHTLATVLKGAGYATAAIGKWGLQGGRSETDRDSTAGTPADWPGYPTRRGFDFYHGYVRHRDGHAHYPREDKKQVWENEREISADLAGCYTTDLFTARAKKWIADQRAAAAEQPWFLYLAYDTPHAKTQRPPGEFPREGLRWLGEPGRMINTAAGEPDSYLHPDYATATWDHDRDAATPEQPWPDVYKRFATSVRRIDDCVGDLLAFLKELGIDRDTLVVFTSDNGPSKESYLPENLEPTFFDSYGPMDGIKRDLWEGGIRVGALARWPARIPPGRVSDEPGQFHDWMTTFADMAGVPAPARADGVSLLPALTGSGAQNPSTVYVEYNVGGKTPPYPEFEPARRGRAQKQMQAIRRGEFIGVRYNIAAHGDPFEIYNVVADPKQTRNLAGGRADLQQQMRDAVLRLRMPNSTAPRPYDGERVPALAQAPRTAAGVEVRAFSKLMPWLAKLDDLAPDARFEAPQFQQIRPPAGAPPSALLVRGHFTVPADGAYTFTLPAKAEALLRIHDATVIDAAFTPAAEEASGTIQLAAGVHPFRLYWRMTAAAPALALDWSGPGIARQPLPEAALTQPEK
jgi:arylsulfatase A-like enzyme